MTFLERLQVFLSSAIIRQQLGALIGAGVALVGLTADVDVINQHVETIIVAVLAAIPVLTIATRLFKPQRNLTMTAVSKEVEMKEAGTITEDGAHPKVK